MSAGRLSLGIGASWLRDQWDAVGVDFDRRGARIDEAIDVCRPVVTDEVIVRPWRRSSEAIDAVNRFADDVLS